MYGKLELPYIEMTDEEIEDELETVHYLLRAVTGLDAGKGEALILYDEQKAEHVGLEIRY